MFVLLLECRARGYEKRESPLAFTPSLLPSTTLRPPSPKPHVWLAFFLRRCQSQSGIPCTFETANHNAHIMIWFLISVISIQIVLGPPVCGELNCLATGSKVGIREGRNERVRGGRGGRGERPPRRVRPMPTRRRARRLKAKSGLPFPSSQVSPISQRLFLLRGLSLGTSIRLSLSSFHSKSKVDRRIN